MEDALEILLSGERYELNRLGVAISAVANLASSGLGLLGPTGVIVGTMLNEVASCYIPTREHIFETIRIYIN